MAHPRFRAGTCYLRVRRGLDLGGGLGLGCGPGGAGSLYFNGQRDEGARAVERNCG